MAGRKGEYLFKRRGSSNWWVRFQIPAKIAEECDLKPKTEKSLGTSDRTLAEIRAAPEIRAHKWLLYQMRLQSRPETNPFLAGEIRHEYEPGKEHQTPDGDRVIATEKDLIFLAEDGRIVSTRPNSKIPHFRIPVPAERWDELVGPAASRSKRSKFSDDDQLVEAYIRHAGLKPHNAHEARSTYALYKEVVGKPLARAERQDGRKLAKHLIEELGNKSATVEKKVGWLRAAVNMAIEDQKLTFNPFQKVVPKAGDGMQKLPLSDEDMELARKKLDRLSSSDQLLWKLLATTGMRLGEAFQITEEFAEHVTGQTLRYVIVGTKTESSERRIPLPTSLIPELPPKIDRILFEGESKAAGKRMMRFLREIGIKDPRKTTHCLRHRAKDRLRMFSCPIDVQYALLGHEKKTVAASYGQGFPGGLLLTWIDKIGW